MTYQGERLEENVRELADGLTDPLVLPLRRHRRRADRARCSRQVERSFGGLDFRRARRRVRRRAKISRTPFVQTTRDGFKLALDVSAYSLIALSRGALPLMEKRGGGSILTLTYLGSERVFQNYNVMGVAKAALESTVRYLAADLGPKNIRVNAISAGPIKTLAAAGISGFSSILQVYRDRAPLRRTVETAEVADAAMFLLSDAGRARHRRSVDGRRRVSRDRHVARPRTMRGVRLEKVADHADHRVQFKMARAVGLDRFIVGNGHAARCGTYKKSLWAGLHPSWICPGCPRVPRPDERVIPRLVGAERGLVNRSIEHCRGRQRGRAERSDHRVRLPCLQCVCSAFACRAGCGRSGVISPW